MQTIRLIAIFLVFFVSACADDKEGKAAGDHVWKEQTATIDKAKEVEGLLKKSAEDQAKAIEEKMQ